MDIRGVYGFSSLVKQNKKLKFTLSFASPEKENYFFNICDVITSPEKEKSSANHYCSVCACCADQPSKCVPSSLRPQICRECPSIYVCVWSAHVHMCTSHTEQIKDIIII